MTDKRTFNSFSEAARAKGLKAARAKSHTERRKMLISKFGTDPDVMTLISEALEIESEIASTRRGAKETTLDRRRERRLWADRLDTRMRMLDARPFDREQALNDARRTVILGLSNVETATAYLEAADPSWLTGLEERRGAMGLDDWNTFRLLMLSQHYSTAANYSDLMVAFLNSICDEDGNPPSWWTAQIEPLYTGRL